MEWQLPPKPHLLTADCRACYQCQQSRQEIVIQSLPNSWVYFSRVLLRQTTAVHSACACEGMIPEMDQVYWKAEPWFAESKLNMQAYH